MQKVAQALWREILPRGPVFATREAAAAAGVSGDQASRDLGRLARLGLLQRVARGVWSDPRGARLSAYAAVPALVALGGPRARGYVSVLSALSLHGMISQVPRIVHVVVDRRARRTRRTALGTYRFHTLAPALMDGFVPAANGTFLLATPAKAVFDTLYLGARRGRRYAHLPELVVPVGFPVRELEGWIAQVRSVPLQRAIRARWARLRGSGGITRARRATG